MNGIELVWTAKKYLGQNGEKFCRDYGIPFGSHWCCAFVWDIFRISGASRLFYSGQRTAYVPTAQMWFAANCEHVSMANARAGDIVVFTWSGNGYNHEHGSRDHIGFIRKAGTTSTAYTLEGNTGGTNPMTSKVMERERSAQFIFGIYRPNYAEKNVDIKPDKPNTNNQPSAQKKTAKKQNNTVRIDARYKIISRIGMNIRKQPSVTSKRVGGIGYGKTVRASRKRGDWIYIKYGKAHGWIKASTSYCKKI